MSFRGKKHTAEAKAKMSINCSAKRPEVRAKMSRAAMGKKLSEETKAKLRRISAARPPEVRAKMSRAQKGRKHSLETRAKISKVTTKRIQEGSFHPEQHGLGGDFYSKKNKQTLHYRSQLELGWYQILEQLSKVKKYHVEPVVIEYEWEGAIHRYIPDLRIRYMDGTTELVEIKPEDRWEEPKNLAKWKAAREWCEGRKIPTVFRVVGYEGLN